MTATVVGTELSFLASASFCNLFRRAKNPGYSASMARPNRQQRREMKRASHERATHEAQKLKDGEVMCRLHGPRPHNNVVTCGYCKRLACLSAHPTLPIAEEVCSCGRRLLPGRDEQGRRLLFTAIATCDRCAANVELRPPPGASAPAADAPTKETPTP